MSLLSPERTRTLEERLREVGREARATGRSLLMLHAERMDDAPSALELFAGASHDGFPRFFAARPSQGFELVALGCAASVAAHSAQGVRRLRSRCDALRERMRPTPPEDGSTPLWLGGMAFDPEPTRRASHWSAYGAARFVLPALMVVRREGETWLRFALEVNAQTRFSDALARWESWLEKRGFAPRSAAPPLLCAEPRAAARYLAAVERGIAAVRAGTLHKVVLACEEKHATSACAEAALHALCAAHPSCLVFAQGIGASVFVGATPELLVRRCGTRIETSAVAATAQRGSAALARRLQRPKERREHALVVDDLAQRLGPLCTELSVPEEPVLLDTGTLQHLLTPIRGRLAQPAHALDLVTRLHPTPALGGAPREIARQLIRTLEGFDRGWYGGPIGWFDAHGNGEFHVALRCAWIGPDELRLYAGSGLVAESEPAGEARETALKLASVREVLATR